MQDPSTYSQINPQFPEHEHLKCPRCDSNNTKFCYYNNYNLSQPRHFCKNCRRYWTKGGTLRNIPIGGGTRKTTKRSSNPKRSPTSPSPSPASAPATSTSPTTASSLTAQSLPKQEAAGDRDGRVVDVGGSFSSLLTSDGQFGHFTSMESLQVGGFTEDPNSDESGMIPNPLIEFRTTNNNVSDSCLGDGDGSDYWSGGNGWPGLSIYTPPALYGKDEIFVEEIKNALLQRNVIEMHLTSQNAEAQVGELVARSGRKRSSSKNSGQFNSSGRFKDVIYHDCKETHQKVLSKNIRDTSNEDTIVKMKGEFG